MNTRRIERRQFPLMRIHIDSMIAAGAVILGRDPLKIMHRGRIHTLLYGILISEGLDLWPVDPVVIEVNVAQPPVSTTA